MDVFVIHSTKDAEAVNANVSKAKREIYSLNALVLKNGNCFWKIEAASKIKKAQMVIFFVGANSHSSPYIAWELEKAMKHNKPIYTVFLDPNNQNHQVLKRTDKFSGEEVNYDISVTMDELIGVIKSHENGDYKIFNQDVEKMDTNILFEQYKMFLQTSESLVERRQSVNSFYISVNSAFVALFGSLLAISIDLKYKLILSIVFAAVGIVLSVSWIKILISYGNLNSSKMTIIRSIEKQLPASLYDAEWQALSDQLNKKKYVSFTNNEKKIPLIFIIIYVSIAAIVFLMFGLNLLG